MTNAAQGLRRPGKTDYNFEYDRQQMYDGVDWTERQAGQPFFAQIQLKGGKDRRTPIENPVDPEEVTLPPYYPRHPVLLREWAEYLDSVRLTDRQVGRILQRLKAEGVAAQTVVFFFTDHGDRTIRHKQFLYDGGLEKNCTI